MVNGTLVRVDGYPAPERFDEPAVAEYGLFSRYADAAALLEASSLSVDRVEPAAASVDDLRLCCSERRLRRLLGSPPAEPRTVSSADPELWAEALAVGGTLAATEAVLEAATETGAATDSSLEGPRAVHLGGGFHHAHRGGSSARTLFNDVVAAVERARRRDAIDRIAVVDLDVHHHDGTRAVYRLDGDVSLFSMHGWNLFPGTGWLHETGRGHAAGNHLNVPLPAGTDGRTTLAVLERLLPPWLRRVDPDLVVYVAGADVHAADPTGNLRLTVGEIHERDRLVAEYVGDRPLAAVVGGGYGPEAGTIHANTAAAILAGDGESGPIRTPERPEIEPSERPAPEAQSDDAPRVTARRWLSELVDHCERRYGGLAAPE